MTDTGFNVGRTGIATALKNVDETKTRSVFQVSAMSIVETWSRRSIAGSHLSPAHHWCDFRCRHNAHRSGRLLVQAKLSGCAFHRPRKLQSPAIRRAAQPDGNCHPGCTLTAALRELAFLLGQTLPEPIQEITSSNDFARVAIAGERTLDGIAALAR